MRSGVIAQKVGMTRVYNDAGEHIPVTVLRLDNCQVVAHRTEDKNGYTAVQLGAGTSKVKNTVKALRGQFAAASVEPKAKLVEFRRMIDSVKVGMPQRQVQRLIGLDDGEARARHFALVAQCLEQPAHQRRLAGAKRPVEQHDVARA